MPKLSKDQSYVRASKLGILTLSEPSERNVFAAIESYAPSKESIFIEKGRFRNLKIFRSGWMEPMNYWEASLVFLKSNSADSSAAQAGRGLIKIELLNKADCFAKKWIFSIVYFRAQTFGGNRRFGILWNDPMNKNEL